MHRIGVVVRLVSIGFVGLLACGCDGAQTELTVVRLDVHVPEEVAVSVLEVRVGTARRTLPLQTDVRVLLPDTLADTATAIEVRGLRGSNVLASGRVRVTPVRGSEVRATVTLARVACGAWCVPAATECRGEAIVLCEQRDDDPCMEWSEPIACPAAAPTCSLGRCDVRCTDECAAGEVRCDGPLGTRTCGQADADTCLEWRPTVACPEGEVCTAGACVTTCHDECTAGASRCLAQGREICGDLNADGCLEWGPVQPCPASEACVDGACASVSSCRDECDVDTCEGDTHRTCGNFDLDPCRELSAGTRCVAEPGSCDVVSCSPSGCARTPRTCAPDAGVTLPDASGAPPDAAMTTPDAGSDVRVDAGVSVLAMDAGTDAGSDAGNDAGRDAGSDGGNDAGSDAGPDAGRTMVPRIPPSGLVSAVTETVDNTAITTHPLGFPFIVYTDVARHDVRFVAWTGTSWRTELIDGLRTATHPPSAATSWTGETFIAYIDDDSSSLVVARRSNPDVVESVSLHDGGMGSAAAVAVAPDRTVIVVGCDEPAQARFWLYRSTTWGRWTSSVYAPPAPIADARCNALSVAAASDGSAVVGFGTTDFYLVRVDTMGRHTWYDPRVEGYVGAVGVRSTGPYMVRGDLDHSLFLMQGTWSGPMFTSELVEMAVSGTTTGSYRHVRVATDASDRVHVLLRHPVTPEIRHLVRGTAGWTTTLVASGVRDPSISLAVDRSGNAHVAYADVAGRLNFAVIAAP